MGVTTSASALADVRVRRSRREPTIGPLALRTPIAANVRPEAPRLSWLRVGVTGGRDPAGEIFDGRFDRDQAACSRQPLARAASVPVRSFGKSNSTTKPVSRRTTPAI